MRKDKKLLALDNYANNAKFANRFMELETACIAIVLIKGFINIAKDNFNAL